MPPHRHQPDVDPGPEARAPSPAHEAPVDHCRRCDPKPEPRISAARMTAAVARIGRHYARACESLPVVFGLETAAAVVLHARATALRTANGTVPRIRQAERLHQLATWLLAACETIETEDGQAANLAVDLGVIVAECELLISVADHAGVDAEPGDVGDDAAGDVNGEELAAAAVLPPAA